MSRIFLYRLIGFELLCNNQKIRSLSDCVSKNEVTIREKCRNRIEVPTALLILFLLIACNKKADTPSNAQTFTNDIGMEFVLIPAGEFMMGCNREEKKAIANANEKGKDPECGADEKPAHKVKITKPFYMGKYEVTQRQWKAVMGTEPSNFKIKDDCKFLVFCSERDLPVEQVSWNDAQEFIKKLNESTAGTRGGASYRLPTEAEWEYAARGGSKTVYYWGDLVTTGFLWYNGNSGSKTHQVGEKHPNTFGLYDMAGNVWEWTEDWYGEKYYLEKVEIDPTGPASGEKRVLRGGSWNVSAHDVRSSIRFGYSPSDANYAVGFRLVAPAP